MAFIYIVRHIIKSFVHSIIIGLWHHLIVFASKPIDFRNISIPFFSSRTIKSLVNISVFICILTKEIIMELFFFY